MKDKIGILSVFSGTQALYQIGTVMMLAVGSLAGRSLAPSPEWGSFPLALSVVGTLAALFPAAYWMKHRGRRTGLLLGTSLGIVGALLICASLFFRNFALFSLGHLVYGLHQAFLQYLRFAAMESVEKEHRSVALSWVLVAGIPAAFLGPLAGLVGKELFPQFLFLGSYGFLVGALTLQFCVLFFVPRHTPSATTEGNTDAAEVRPLSVHLKNPGIWAAVSSSAIGYGLMVMLMAAAPVAMMSHGHPLSASTLVIQAHVLGMYIPSFFSGILLKKMGPRRLILSGSFLMTLQIFAVLSGASFLSFAVTLVLLGIGWNFMYVGGTSLLVEQYRPSEKSLVQALNDTTVFSFSALSTYGASSLEATIGWLNMNLLALPFLALVVVLLLTVRPGHGARV